MKRNDYIYAGIGSRKTPTHILTLMEQAATKLAQIGYLLRSGGADGADTSFEVGCDIGNGQKQIFLPWKGFNNNNSPFIKVEQDSIDIAASFHPNPNFLTMNQAIQKLMGRNTYQIIGQELNSLCGFVLCWTPDGSDGINIKTTHQTGGTGQAIRLACHWEAPVQNLANEFVFNSWSEWIACAS